MTTNEAAERLTPCGECGMRVAPQEYHPFTYCVLYKAGQNPREAFAAERHATVERLVKHRREVHFIGTAVKGCDGCAAILDEEAAR